MKKILLGASIVMAFALTSCTVVMPLAATSNEGTKTGISESTLWFGFGNVDIGIEQAAKNGGISKVATVDYSIKAGLFKTTYKTIVTGN